MPRPPPPPLAFSSSGKPYFGDGRLGGAAVGEPLFGARDTGMPMRQPRLTRRDFVAHASDASLSGPMKVRPASSQRSAKRAVLGEKAIAGIDGVAFQARAVSISAPAFR